MCSIARTSIVWASESRTSTAGQPSLRWRRCAWPLQDNPIVFRQTNSEEQLINWVHEAIDDDAGIIIDPAAFTFTSLALLDALKMFEGPVIEFHISNIHRREPIYHRSYVSMRADVVMAGLGAKGYATAVAAMLELVTGR